MSSSSHTKNNFLPSSVGQFLQLIFYSNKEPFSIYGFEFPPHFQLIVDCLKLQREWWHDKRWVLCDIFWMKYAKSSELTLLVNPNYIPCILSSMEVEGKKDRSWQGQKWPCFPSLCAWIQRFANSRNWGENGCSFFKEMIAWQWKGRGTLPW